MNMMNMVQNNNSGVCLGCAMRFNPDWVKANYPDYCCKNVGVSVMQINSMNMMNQLSPINYNTLELIYETKEDNAKINIIGGFFYDFAKSYITLLDPEKNQPIFDFVYTFDSKGEHKIILIVRENIKNFNGMFHKCNNLKNITGHLDVCFTC